MTAADPLEIEEGILVICEDAKVEDQIGENEYVEALGEFLEGRAKNGILARYETDSDESITSLSMLRNAVRQILLYHRELKLPHALICHWNMKERL